ncbi:MAG: S-methyl-5-thioribose-1-phosphate isomerase [Candidatus Omnitrophota bacterium]
MNMAIKTLEWKNNALKIIDQTKLPLKLEYVYCKNLKTLWQAIKTLKVRGAPALGVAAAFAVFLGIKDFKGKTKKQFIVELDRVIKYIKLSRPTAVNLFWALDRLRELARKNLHKPIGSIKKLLLKEAFKILEEDRTICRKMADYGVNLIKKRDRILTICNAGALATVDYGTALGVIYRAKEVNKKIKVYSCETRPLLQGARLTTWELKRAGIDVTLISDNMAADLMRKKMINKVLVGADRIASNGDTANKIGTYNLAILAKYHKIPFYVVGPISTFDLKIKNGRRIPIEQRHSREVTQIQGKQIAPLGIRVYNPAFDVTDNSLISAIITEKGIIRPPFTKNIKNTLKKEKC